jgi:hypothetical protein
MEMPMRTSNGKRHISKRARRIILPRERFHDWFYPPKTGCDEESNSSTMYTDLSQPALPADIMLSVKQLLRKHVRLCMSQIIYIKNY